MPSTQCGWCGRHSNMTRASQAELLRNQSEYTGLGMCAYRCDYCNGVNVAIMTTNWSMYRTLDDAFESDDQKLSWRPRRLVDKTYEDVPKHIAEAAAEAHLANSVEAYRGAAQLARSVIEATAKAQGIAKGHLYDKIEALFERQLVREHVRDAAHEIRHLGNDMAHGDFIEPVDPVEADEVLALMDEVLDEVFQSPARVERRRQARLAKKAGGEAAGP